MQLYINEISQEYIKKLQKSIEQRDILLEEKKECLCGSTELSILETSDRFNLAFKSCLCSSCGLVFRSPRISEASLASYYEKYYHPINYGKTDLQHQEVLFKRGQGEKIYHLLSPFLPTRKKLKVLELGAGTGSVLKELTTEAKKFDRELEVTALEYSSACIKECRKKNLEVFQGGLEKLEELKKAYDVIILSHVFEHLLDLGHSLEILKNSLVEDGLLYLEVPGIYAIHRTHHYSYNYKLYTTHAHNYDFTRKTLQKYVQEQGLVELYGNENVEAIYTKQKLLVDVKSLQDSSEAQNILFYISFLENNREYFLNISQRTKFLSHGKYESVNYDFSCRMNSFYSFIHKLVQSKQSFVVYGYGTIGKLLCKELGSLAVLVIDKNNYDNKNIYEPKYLLTHSYDRVLIAVLGREDEVIADLVKLGIAQEKIQTVELL